MTCEQCNDRLGDAVDGTLDAEGQAQIDAHCRGCAACRELLNDLKDIRAAAATLERHMPSAELWRAIAAQAQSAVAAPPLQRGNPATSWPRLGQLAAAAALVMMLGAAAWFGARWQPRRHRRGNSVRPRAERCVRAAARRTTLSERHYGTRAVDREQRRCARPVGRRRNRAEPEVDRPRDRRESRRIEVRSQFVCRADQPARSASHEGRAAAGDRIAHERRS